MIEVCETFLSYILPLMGIFRIPDTLLIPYVVFHHDPESHDQNHDISRSKQIIDMSPGLGSTQRFMV